MEVGAAEVEAVEVAGVAGEDLLVEVLGVGVPEAGALAAERLEGAAGQVQAAGEPPAAAVPAQHFDQAAALPQPVEA